MPESNGEQWRAIKISAEPIKGTPHEINLKHVLVRSVVGHIWLQIKNLK